MATLKAFSDYFHRFKTLFSKSSEGAQLTQQRNNNNSGVQGRQLDVTEKDFKKSRRKSNRRLRKTQDKGASFGTFTTASNTVPTIELHRTASFESPTKSLYKPAFKRLRNSSVKRRNKRPSSLGPRPNSLILFSDDLCNRTQRLFSAASVRSLNELSSGLRSKAGRLFTGSSNVIMDMSAEIRLNDNTLIPMEMFSKRLNDYNTYFNGSQEQLRSRMTKNGELIIDGKLNIYWGLKNSIVLQHTEPQQADDENEPESKKSLTRKRSSKEMRRKSNTRRNIRSSDTNENEENKGDDHLSAPCENEIRATSVRLRKRVSRNTAFRASINGHFYKLETSVFTPTYGSVTKVRVTSASNTQDVIKKLFQKFKVENSEQDFSLYVIKETEERLELQQNEFPLLRRVLMGPNEKLGKIFIMEKKMYKNISSEVAQYIKMDPNILRVFLSKFAEEERNKVSKLKKRYEFYRKMLVKHIREQQRLQQQSS